jgi:hypothetical protein
MNGTAADNFARTRRPAARSAGSVARRQVTVEATSCHPVQRAWCGQNVVKIAKRQRERQSPGLVTWDFVCSPDGTRTRATALRVPSHSDWTLLVTVENPYSARFSSCAIVDERWLVLNVVLPICCPTVINSSRRVGYQSRSQLRGLGGSLGCDTTPLRGSLCAHRCALRGSCRDSLRRTTHTGSFGRNHRPGTPSS